MYALATPELKELLHGIVIMDSSPNASWQESFIEYVENNPLPAVQRLQTLYEHEYTNENLKQVTLASIPYVSSRKELTKDFSFFEHLPYNARACDWSSEHFDQIYCAQWIPDKLIFAGDSDHIAPLELFLQAPEFNHENIVMRIIKDAGHYPWIENMNQVKMVFKDYCQRLGVGA